MGTPIEINDTLKLSKPNRGKASLGPDEQVHLGDSGFPAELTLETHVLNPNILFEKVKGKMFPFSRKGERLFSIPPTRVFLVEEIDGKWLYWGHAMVKEQTIREGRTEGLYEIVKLYEPEYQRLATINEAPKGKSYFEEK